MVCIPHLTIAAAVIKKNESIAVCFWLLGARKFVRSEREKRDVEHRFRIISDSKNGAGFRPRVSSA